MEPPFPEDVCIRAPLARLVVICLVAGLLEIPSMTPLTTCLDYSLMFTLLLYEWSAWREFGETLVSPRAAQIGNDKVLFAAACLASRAHVFSLFLLFFFSFLICLHDSCPTASCLSQKPPLLTQLGPHWLCLKRTRGQKIMGWGFFLGPAPQKCFATTHCRATASTA